MLRALTMNATRESADKIENCTFDEIAVGDSASLTRTLARDDIALFAVMFGDVNSAHLDERYADGVRSISVLVTNGKHRRWFPCAAIHEPA